VTKLYQHPDYARKARAWKMYRDLYEGDHATLTSEVYLWPHVLERASQDGARIRQIREQRSRYTNFIESIVSTLQSIFFVQSPDIEEAREQFGESGLLDDVNGTGADLLSFIKNDIFVSYILYGYPIVFVDALPTRAVTVAEAQAAGLRPFLQVLNPIDVVDWWIEPGAGFQALRFEYFLDEPRTNLEEKPKRTRYSRQLFLENGIYSARRYRLATNEEVEASQSLKNPLSSGDWMLDAEMTVPGLERLPVAAIFNQESWIKDAAQEALRFFNLVSTRDNILNNQAYQRLFVASDIDDDAFLAIGEYTIGRLPKDSNVIAIEPTSTEAIEKAISSSSLNIFKVAFNQSRALPSDSASIEAADTIAERKQDLLSMVLSSIDELEKLTNDALSLYARFAGIEGYSAKVKFSRDITQGAIEQQLQMFAANRDLIARFPTWEKAWAKKVVKKMALPEEAEIIEEIDNDDEAGRERTPDAPPGA
jgi:hypothetical protein